jgi:hypothetical protein
MIHPTHAATDSRRQTSRTGPSCRPHPPNRLLAMTTQMGVTEAIGIPAV